MTLGRRHPLRMFLGRLWRRRRFRPLDDEVERASRAQVAVGARNERLSDRKIRMIRRVAGDQVKLSARQGGEPIAG
jgi:hypothetical protein